MLFGTSGIRGDAEKLFSYQFCFDIGRTFSKFLENHGKKGCIAIGMDSRESSQRIKCGIIDGILLEGNTVIDEGISPSPAINYIMLADPTIIGSVMVTGSHIRGDYNGIKLFFDQKEILKEHEREIEEIYEEIKGKTYSQTDPHKNRNLIINRVRIDDNANLFYQEMLYSLAEKPYPNWKIVLDLGNGCQCKIMPQLFKSLGIDTIIINNELRSDKFIARDTETEEAVKDLQEKVKELNADMGIAFDGDGDRVVFVDNNGRFIPGDYTGSIISKYGDTPVVVAPINVSQVIKYIGKPVILTKVGSPYVVEAIEDNSATFGFEANGGGISKEIMLSRDAGSSVIKILNILNKNNTTLKNLVNTFPRFALYRTKIDCPTKIYPIILERAKKEFKGIIEDIDGIKIWKDDNTWILFRPSSNEPAFRIFSEAKTEEEALQLGNRGIDFVTSIRNSMEVV